MTKPIKKKIVPVPNIEKHIALAKDEDGNALVFTDLISKSELMQMLDLSERTIDNWREKGTVASTKIGGKVFFLISDINRILSQNIRRKKDESK